MLSSYPVACPHEGCSWTGGLPALKSNTTNANPASVRLGPGNVLWPNGIKIMLALGLGARLRQIGHSLERVVTRTHQGEPLSEMPVGELERKLGAPVYPVSRTVPAGQQTAGPPPGCSPCWSACGTTAARFRCPRPSRTRTRSRRELGAKTRSGGRNPFRTAPGLITRQPRRHNGRLRP